MNDMIELQPEQEVSIKAGKFKIIIKHNDVGISADIYFEGQATGAPIEEAQWWFDDYEELIEEYGL